MAADAALVGWMGWRMRDASSRAYVAVAAGLAYPLWWLLTPDGAIDPPGVWLALGLGYFSLGLLAILAPARKRLALSLLPWLSGIITAQIMTLAAVNGMHPFYAVGSAMALTVTAFFLSTTFCVACFGAYALVAGAVLFAIEPDPMKIAYWGGSIPAIGVAYYRLREQNLEGRLQREHRRELESQVALRTQDLLLANERLREEIQRGEWLENKARVSQKVDALGRMAGGIAHDFSNLITTIGVYTELLATSLPPDSAQQGDLRQIQEAADEAAGLIHQLVAVTRNQEVAAEPVDLNEVVSEMSDLLNHMLGSQVELRLDLCPGPVVVECNREQVHQVLLNLILNARDAVSKRGRVSIETEIRRNGDPRLPGFGEVNGDYVLLAVSDDGVGMTRELQSRIFDPFFTTKPVNEGTGLGLSTVYSIVDRAHGHVVVESEPGRGARFETYWPCSELPVSVSPERFQSHPVPGVGRRVMLVEDEDDLRRALARVLGMSGYEVIEAADGEEALRIAGEADTIDLVVSDIVMPKMSGIELVERLAETRPGLEVLLMSGQRSHPSLRDRELPAGVPLLSKPFAPQDFARRVGEVLAQA